jgi:hypothetical protein
MKEEQLRPTELAKMKMPEYRADWTERATDALEELRPTEFRQLTETGALEDRVKAMVNATEQMLLTLLGRGMELDEALREAAETSLSVEPEPESFEEEEAETRTTELAVRWLEGTPPARSQ